MNIQPNGLCERTNRKFEKKYIEKYKRGNNRNNHKIRIDHPPPSRVSKLPEIQLFQFKIIILPFLEPQTSHISSNHPPRNIL